MPKVQVNRWFSCCPTLPNFPDAADSYIIVLDWGLVREISHTSGGRSTFFMKLLEGLQSGLFGSDRGRPVRAAFQAKGSSAGVRR
jgi:hypothetical protein